MHLNASDLQVLWFELSEEERKPWNEHAVDFNYSSCPKVLTSMAKQQLVQREAVTCAGAVIVAWWGELWRPSGYLKDLDTLGIDLATPLTVINLTPPPVDLVVKVLQEPMEDLNQLDVAADDFILPLSPTSPSNAGLRNPPPPRSPLLIHQLRTVPKVTCNGERLRDYAMSVQGS